MTLDEAQQTLKGEKMKRFVVTAKFGVQVNDGEGEKEALDLGQDMLNDLVSEQYEEGTVLSAVEDEEWEDPDDVTDPDEDEEEDEDDDEDDDDPDDEPGGGSC